MTTDDRGCIDSGVDCPVCSVSGSRIKDCYYKHYY